MKIEATSILRLLAVVAAMAILSLPAMAGEIYVVEGDTVGVYPLTGATMQNTLVSGFTTNPSGVAVSGSNLFVLSAGTIPGFVGQLGEYNATTGATTNASLIAGLSSPYGIAASGGNLFVADSGNLRIGEYTAAGTTVNASLISGLSKGPVAVAVSGNTLFVANAGTINTNTGFF